MRENLKGIIFDFDGVIANSVHLKSDAFVELYSPFGEKIAKKVLFHHESNGGMSRFEKFKFYHNTFLDKKISDNEINELSKLFSKLVVHKIIKSTYVPGVLNFIKETSQKYKLFISTGTPSKEINLILRGKNIDTFFSEVYGSPEKKQIHLEKIIKKYNFSSDELLFFGFFNVDFKAARDKKIEFILIKNKYNKFFRIDYIGESINNFKTYEK